VSLVVLDTDVASSLLRRRVPEPLTRALSGSVLAVTFVTVGELTKWTLVRHWGPRSLGGMRAFLDRLVVLPYDRRVPARWGELQAYAQLRGRPRPVNDTWIAACCLVRDAPLATLNTKDFTDYVDHEGLILVTP
jgi:toxin FitB